MTDSVIECRNLTHCYGERLIYKDLSFEVPRGRILGLLGKNGTGKTTTINILSGYLQPRAGQCLIFGEDIRTMRPETRARIALLIEGHVQYAFMTIEQIERFYARFYPRWNRDAYYGLMEMLKVAPRQRISRMSCGQRSQVALGLILAQNADLLVLDDFSMGLDPGYRRLFVEYLRDYAQSEEKTVFLTSHIIQDMEKLVDDCIIMDYGSILVQMPVGELLGTFRRYTFTPGADVTIPAGDGLYHPSVVNGRAELYSFDSPATVQGVLERAGIVCSDLRGETLNLEDAFIGLTGKYKSRIMIKAIFYKEWIKMRCFYPLSALFLFGATAYALLRVQRVITFKGAAHVWEVMLEKEVVFIDILQYLPALLGVLLAVVQFVPEMAQKRLKLTLHLPFPQWKMILLMSGIGLGALALLFIVQTAVLWGYFHALLAPELVARILLTALPWYLAGLTLYLLTAWICLEPTWKRRLANLLIAVGVCRIFFLSDTPQAYDGMLPWLALLLVCSLFFPLLSVYRFKQGCQD